MTETRRRRIPADRDLCAKTNAVRYPTRAIALDAMAKLRARPGQIRWPASARFCAHCCGHHIRFTNRPPTGDPL